MGHADANSVRGRWKDSVTGEPHQLAGLQPRPRPRPFSALQSSLQESGLTRIVNWVASDRFEKIGLPFLLSAVLLLVGGFQMASIWNERNRAFESSAQQIKLTGELIAARLEANPTLLEALESPTLARVFLESAIPDSQIEKERHFFLIGRGGKVVTNIPYVRSLQNLHLKRLLGEKSSLFSNPKTTYHPAINFDGSTQSSVLLTPIASALEASSILVMEPHVATLDAWYAHRNNNIILFFTIAAVLGMSYLAYRYQGRKAVRAESLFDEAHDRFDTALERGHCGLWDWDLSRGRIVWSSSMFRMLGMEPMDRVLGFGDLEPMMHQMDADILEIANAAFNARDRVIDHRFRMQHSSGTWIWLRMRAELVETTDAAPHLIGIAVDVTEQEQLKRKHRDADNRLRDAIENISEAFVLWDSRKRMVMCNSKYQQLYNLPASIARGGGHYDEVMTQSRKPRIRKQISTEKRSSAGAQILEAQLEDGRWLQISERRTQDGGFVSIGTDITQIKRNEEKLVDSERRLIATVEEQRRVQQKTDLQAQKLVELAEKYSEEKNRAEAASRSKSEFLANISHELRTPLNAIIGFSDIMQTGMFGPLGSEKYEEYSQDIHHSGTFLLGVINDVLDMSKIEAGRIQLTPETVRMDELLNETLRIIKVQADHAKITVDRKVQDNLTLSADRRAVKQILLNLLSNAVKFTPEGGQISVTAKSSRRSVNIIIEDNGIGISRKALRRIGQPFEQVQDQFTKDHKGSGLGLAIAKSLTKLHGGTLKIRSEVGRGTIVAVRLPMVSEKFAPISSEFDHTQEDAA